VPEVPLRAAPAPDLCLDAAEVQPHEIDGQHPDRLVQPDDGLPTHFRRVVSFHPRGGRLNPVQRRAFDAHAAHWYLELDDLAGGADVDGLFGRKAPLILEIGSGMGEATAAMAAARPEANILAVEVYKPGVAQTFHHLARADVDNVRVVRADAVRLLSECIEPGRLAELWLFFPDPWPKTRHLKRRLVNPEFVELVVSRLEKGGVLRMATDWAPYAQQMLAVCTGSRALRNRHPGWAPRPKFRPPTRFERRGLNAGHEIFDLEFVRR